MLIHKAQREVRTVFMGGFAGQLVSGIIWLVSAALATWLAPKVGIWVLVRHFVVLAAILVGGGVVLGLYVQDTFALGGWIAGAVLVVFALVGLFAVKHEGIL